MSHGDGFAKPHGANFGPLQTSATLAASFQFDTPALTNDGLADYSGQFKRDFCLEDLSHGMLATTCKEFMLDVFLLNYACYNAIAERQGEEHITPMAQEQYHHLAPVTVHRLRNAFDIRGDDLAAILKVLQLNPFTPHDYFDLGYALPSGERALVWLNDCAGYREPVKRGMAALMVAEPDAPGFHRLAQEVNPQAVIRPVDVSEVKDYATDAVQAWEIIIDADATPAKRSDWADITGKAMWDHDNSRHVYLYERYDQAG